MLENPQRSHRSPSNLSVTVRGGRGSPERRKRTELQRSWSPKRMLMLESPQRSRQIPLNFSVAVVERSDLYLQNTQLIIFRSPEEGLSS